MKILSEKKREIVDMELDLSEEDYTNLLNYAERSITREEYEALLIEWAFVEIIKKATNYGQETAE